MVTLDMKGLHALSACLGFAAHGPDVEESPLPLGDTSEKWGGGQGPQLCPRAPRAPLRSQKPQAFFSFCKWQPEFRVESASLPLALVQHSSLSE